MTSKHIFFSLVIINRILSHIPSKYISLSFKGTVHIFLSLVILITVNGTESSFSVLTLTHMSKVASTLQNLRTRLSPIFNMGTNQSFRYHITYLNKGLKVQLRLNHPPFTLDMVHVMTICGVCVWD